MMGSAVIMGPVPEKRGAWAERARDDCSSITRGVRKE